MSKVIYQSDWEAWFSRDQFTKLVVICDEHTKAACFDRLNEGYFNNSLDTVIDIPAGESHKTMETALEVFSKLMEMRIDRNALIICLGGGMITDLGGMCAALYKRGTPTLFFPTTLLAMTDAALGGKNGVNFNGVKNQLGAFREPEAVVIDPKFLDTLPERELTAGFAETIKHALIASPDLWSVITERSIAESMKSIDVIRASIEVKQSIVAQDPEDRGIRQSLNFGHTIGHALEALSSKTNQPLLHGEAVAYGMLVELELSQRCCELSTSELSSAAAFIQTIYPEYKPSWNPEDLVQLMIHDKKNHSESIVFSLIDKIGSCKTGIIVDKSEIESALKAVFSSLA